MPAAYLHTLHVHNRAFRVEFAVRPFERLGNALNRFYDLQTLQKINIHAAGIADKPDDGLKFALRNMGLEPARPEPREQAFDLLLAYARLYDCDHVFLLFCPTYKKSPADFAEPLYIICQVLADRAAAEIALALRAKGEVIKVFRREHAFHVYPTIILSVSMVRVYTDLARASSKV
jgi:hypothetical protein